MNSLGVGFHFLDLHFFSISFHSGKKEKKIWNDETDRFHFTATNVPGRKRKTKPIFLIVFYWSMKSQWGGGEFEKTFDNFFFRNFHWNITSSGASSETDRLHFKKNRLDSSYGVNSGIHLLWNRTSKMLEGSQHHNWIKNHSGWNEWPHTAGNRLFHSTFINIINQMLNQAVQQQNSDLCLRMINAYNWN